MPQFPRPLDAVVVRMPQFPCPLAVVVDEVAEEARGVGRWVSRAWATLLGDDEPDDEPQLLPQQQQKRKPQKKKRKHEHQSSSSEDSSSDEEDEYAAEREQARKLLLSSRYPLEREGLQGMHDDLMQLATFALAAAPPKSAQRECAAWKQLKGELQLQGELLAVAAKKGWGAARAARGPRTSKDGFSKKVARNLAK
eukprot:CAMPEP_0202422312 /NCGR_PEP_ID=MMETSP1128-20130828/50792_1 /ASSEMBLY_ACC=CAM_ASM_000463 /TAXON_ID=3047 /ORGANISM="Dunaliella tertiolecta, Strain CCMP1320" /LENGTH=195 /DNA_ID=CAMNT_0049030367 /DNA_START=776 /DNA_END=1363 /DNA_ORIENTATION=-